MNFDLFADLPEPVHSAPVVVATTLQDNRATGGVTMFVEPVNVRAGEELVVVQADEYPMQPAGLNRWTYKGEFITYDTHKLAVPGRGRWAVVEGIGRPAIRVDTVQQACAAIDARSTQ